MIIINFQDTNGKSGIPLSICVGDRPISKVYMKVTNSNTCLYSNFQLENLAVHIYNQHTYSNNNMEESSSTNGTNGKFRYSSPAPSDSTYSFLDVSGTDQKYYRARGINYYDSLLFTANATTDNNYWNPTIGNVSNTIAYVDTSSDGGYKRPLPNLIYKNPNSTGIAEWPHPILLNTSGGTSIEFSEDSQFTNKIIKNSTGRVTFIYNLIPNTHYFYRILNGSTILKTGEFDTEGQIRMIKLDNVLNVRDMGGYTSPDGKRMFKYNKVFRGAQLEQQAETLSGKTTYLTQGDFTAADAYELKSNLKISKEIDLRRLEGTVESNGHLFTDYSISDVNTAITSSLVFPGMGSNFLSYYRMGLTPSSGMSGFEMFLVFLKAVLVNEGATYVHCQEGKDRTGTACALLHGICGISGDGITKDYELTSFYRDTDSTRYILFYWLCADDGKQSGTSTWTERYLIGAIKAQSGSTSTIISDIIQDWFEYNYDNLADDTYKLRDDNNNVINDGTSAIQYTQSKLLISLDPEDPIIPDDPIPSESKNLTVLGGFNITSTLNDGGTSTTIAAKNGKTIEVTSNELSLSTTGAKETILDYIDLEGNSLNNPFSISQDTIVTPKILGNLFYNYRSGKRWTIDTTNSCLTATTTSGFYAMEPFPVVHGQEISFYFPTKASQSVSFEILHTTVAGRFFTYTEYVETNQKVITLTLDAEGKANYLVEGQTGYTFCNFTTTATTGFTQFTTSEINKIRATYKGTSAFNVPTFNHELVVSDVGGIMESAVYYQGYLILFYSSLSPFKMVDINNKTVRTISGSIKNSDIHGNAAYLLPIKYQESDYFPMFLVGESNCKVVRLVGSDPATVTATTVCTWRIQSDVTSTYESNLASGNALVVGSELYTIKSSSNAGLWKAVGFDLSDINNYVDRLKDVNPIIATKVTDDVCGGNYGQDCTSFSEGNKTYLIYSYGPIPLYWGTTHLQRWSGLIISDFETKQIVGFLPLEGSGGIFNALYNEGAEPDGVTYAGNNTFYLVFNTNQGRPVYKITMTLPITELDWSNVKWVPMGDSISDLSLTQASNKYQSYIGSLIPELTIQTTFASGAYKFANAGCGYWLGENSFYDISKYVPTDATVITVFGSMNDRQYQSIPDSTYTSKLSKYNSSTTGTNRITWIDNPHLDTAADKTLAGYVADTLRRLHSYAPKAKVVVIPGLYYKNEDLTVSLNAYFCYQAVVQALIDEENAGSWLSFESWYLDITLTRSIVNDNIRYTRGADSFVEDTKQIDKWLSSNLNQTFDSRKITDPTFGQAYCYDYSASTVFGHWNNAYHQRYLAVKFAHVLLKALGGTENDLPNELKYNNI